METLDWPKVCPNCLSRYEDIHGMIYAVGTATGLRCEHAWHKGPGYDPAAMHLSDEDRAWLSQLQIGCI